MTENEENTELAVIPKFDGITFLNQIESAETFSKKIKIFNGALDQEPIMPKNLKAEMIKKGLNAGNVIRELGKYIDGNGGGQPFFASGKGKNVLGIKDALEKVVEFVK